MELLLSRRERAAIYAVAAVLGARRQGGGRSGLALAAVVAAVVGSPGCWCWRCAAGCRRPGPAAGLLDSSTAKGELPCCSVKQHAKGEDGRLLICRWRGAGGTVAELQGGWRGVHADLGVGLCAWKKEEAVTIGKKEMGLRGFG